MFISPLYKNIVRDNRMTFRKNLIQNTELKRLTEIHIIVCHRCKKLPISSDENVQIVTNFSLFNRWHTEGSSILYISSRNHPILRLEDGGW